MPKPFRLVSEERAEHDIQEEVARTLAVTLGHGAWWSSIDHSNVGPVVGHKRKLRGVQRAIPDMVFIWSDQVGWIELKSRSGRANPEQVELHDKLRACGHHVAVCRSTPEVMDTLAAWGFPLRGRIAA